jgi:RNA recognition motif-containing protein
MKIYIANISFRATEDGLRELLSEFGEVKSLKIITDRNSGRSKGFGFAEMDDENAKNAIANLNGKEYMTRNLIVNEARPQVER